ncbi:MULTISPECIES: VOC family protein [unclassified Vibrio]|uniref:VOC family protein n=1 Tax=Vibrio sp. HB236076 TaxID=3232307 RepID=A0AB39HMF4_9VIBR|nr:VOC family protein [Vibrio sp. HB161653]MDP5252552.1 VOC family protein [Vibrio sp. HB161653]
MLTLAGLDHIVLRTTQRAAMLTFYCEVLGCQIERERPELGLTQLRAGNALIDLVDVDSELGKLGGQAPQQNGRNLDHFCLQYHPQSEEAILQYLASFGFHEITFANRYGAQGYGRSLYINDPEHNVVELKPYLPSSSPVNANETA